MGDICVRIYDQELSWYEAHTFCSKSGYSLALIDSFELDKQLNRVVFDSTSDLVVPSLFNLTVKTSSSSGIKRFWTGIRHLNDSHWFDFKNEPIEFGEDESTWWPWLVVDAASYSQGSCVAKRHGALFLDDCYKRMPFACQIIVTSNTSLKDDREVINSNIDSSQSPVKIEMVVVSGSGLASETATTTGSTGIIAAAVAATGVDLGEDHQHIKSTIGNNGSSDSSKFLFCLLFNFIFLI